MLYNFIYQHCIVARLHKPESSNFTLSLVKLIILERILCILTHIFIYIFTYICALLLLVKFNNEVK